jgi:DNA-directed RNA polymerase subunit RPC12/RpoP
LNALPASQDRASRADGRRMVRQSSPDVINDLCTLYGARRSVIESPLFDSLKKKQAMNTTYIGALAVLSFVFLLAYLCFRAAKKADKQLRTETLKCEACGQRSVRMLNPNADIGIFRCAECGRRTVMDMKTGYQETTNEGTQNQK